MIKTVMNPIALRVGLRSPGDFGVAHLSGQTRDEKETRSMLSDLADEIVRHTDARMRDVSEEYETHYEVNGKRYDSMMEALDSLIDLPSGVPKYEIRYGRDRDGHATRRRVSSIEDVYAYAYKCETLFAVIGGTPLTDEQSAFLAAVMALKE